MLNQGNSRAHGAHRARRMRPPRSMRGLSLVEILVSVLVLAVGLLGVAAMQATALRGGQSSFESTQAVIQTNSILETMRADRMTAANFNTNGMRCAAAAGGNPLVEQWLADLKSAIGVAGDDTICAEIAGCPADCVITVRWDDSRAGGAATRSVVTRARI